MLLQLLRLFTVSTARRSWAGSRRALGATASAPIETVLSDIDGTLLTPSHAATRRRARAIATLRARGCLFVPCTGKCREGALAALGEPGSAASCAPGPASSRTGCACTTATVVFERALARDAARDAARFAASGVDLVGYAGRARS